MNESIMDNIELKITCFPSQSSQDTKEAFSSIVHPLLELLTDSHLNDEVNLMLTKEGETFFHEELTADVQSNYNWFSKIILDESEVAKLSTAVIVERFSFNHYNRKPYLILNIDSANLAYNKTVTLTEHHATTTIYGYPYVECVHQTTPFFGMEQTVNANQFHYSQLVTALLASQNYSTLKISCSGLLSLLHNCFCIYITSPSAIIDQIHYIQRDWEHSHHHVKNNKEEYDEDPANWHRSYTELRTFEQTMDLKNKLKVLLSYSQGLIPEDVETVIASGAYTITPFPATGGTIISATPQVFDAFLDEFVLDVLRAAKARVDQG